MVSTNAKNTNQDSQDSQGSQGSQASKDGPNNQGSSQRASALVSRVTTSAQALLGQPLRVITSIDTRLSWMQVNAYGHLTTPLGDMCLVAHEQGLCGAWFMAQRFHNRSIPPAVEQQIQQQDATQSTDPIMQAAVAWFQAYFALPAAVPTEAAHEAVNGNEVAKAHEVANGNEVAIVQDAAREHEIAHEIAHEGGNKVECPPLLLQGTAFQCAVWQELLKISYGTTLSYGQITKAVAKRLHYPDSFRGYRAVAQAVGNNYLEVIIPCHRVIGVNGQLTGFSAGIERKEWLLRHEGAIS